MLGRRIASGCGIPKQMYTRLGISTFKQANRRLPALVPLRGILARSVNGGGLHALSTTVLSENIVIGGDLTKAIHTLACLGLLQGTLSSTLYANQFLIKLLMDMTCTYRVMKSHHRVE
ncbi:unnamed protein product [Phytomonas sp. Hart1]|nr:unnamed protein product [Phytomonas sp. Hart1]|eukprot:CCW71864.1 unnamed protein product [Phytomonas sp. isolate Hart1]